MSRSESVRKGRPMPYTAALLLVAVSTIAAPGVLGAQHDHPSSTAGRPAAESEMPLMTAVLGPYSRPITTASPRAQEYFDQGMQMVYAFTYSMAIRSFQEAQRLDPACAMCYWGEALARGPFLNGRMTSANAGPAYTAAQKAASLLDPGDSPVERALVLAMTRRYAEDFDEATQARRDSAYSQAMADVYRAHSGDLDVGTLYAESIMLLDPERAQYRLGDPFVQSIHRVLEGVLAKDIAHPGACHIYVHATEATEEPGKAEACADFLGSSIPGASHINHMPSHTYNRIGRWESAVRANVQAWHSDQRAEFGEGVSYARTHNLHMLLFAGSMDGQGAVSALAAEEYARQVNGGVFYHALVLHRFGRFEDVLELTTPPEQPLQRGLWEFARGYAHLRTGSADSARVYLARVELSADTLPESVQLRGHTASQLLGVTGGILRGEILREEGKLDEAIAAFRESVERHDTLGYDEPEPLNFSARHWLGAALLEAGRAAEAEEVYRVNLVQHPHNGWSLFGLEKALRAQGKTTQADQTREEFRRAWARADTMIRSSRF